MTIEGGCYCGKLRYRISGHPVAKGQCHCRACQYFSGGAPNLFVLVAPEQFEEHSGTAQTYRKDGLDHPVTRGFCPDCGTHLTTRRPGLPQIVVKVGTFDDPSQFERPDFAIFTAQGQDFHLVPDGVPTFEGLPPR